MHEAVVTRTGTVTISASCLATTWISRLLRSPHVPDHRRNGRVRTGTGSGEGEGRVAERASEGEAPGSLACARTLSKGREAAGPGPRLVGSAFRRRRSCADAGPKIVRYDAEPRRAERSATCQKCGAVRLDILFHPARRVDLHTAFYLDAALRQHTSSLNVLCVVSIIGDVSQAIGLKALNRNLHCR